MMRKALRDFRPDVVNIHNLYPFISPAVLPLCRKAGVPVVMTVHNYRLVCPTGLFLRDGNPCENCLQKGNERDCLRYNCEHSCLRSLGYALRNMVARRTRAYKDNVDLFCCLTEFQKQKLIAAGFDKDKISIIPNCIEYVEPQETPLPDCDADYVGYVGRLSEEKGYDILIEVARRHPEIEFRFAGTPRDDKTIEVPSNVKLCGHLNSRQLARFYADTRFIVVPSRCYEGFPVALLEAASHRRCCIAPGHGAFPDLMTDKESVLRYERDLVKQVDANNNPVAQVIVIAGKEPELPGVKADLVVKMPFGPKENDFYGIVPYVLVGQLLGFYASKAHGLNPDAPSVSGNIHRVVEGVTIYEN